MEDKKETGKIYQIQFKTNTLFKKFLYIYLKYRHTYKHRQLSSFGDPVWGGRERERGRGDVSSKLKSFYGNYLDWLRAGCSYVI